MVLGAPMASGGAVVGAAIAIVVEGVRRGGSCAFYDVEDSGKVAGAGLFLLRSPTWMREKKSGQANQSQKSQGTFQANAGTKA